MKRKEKIEAWRLERKKGGEPAAAVEGAVNTKQWSLEDDNESEEDEEKKDGEKDGEKEEVSLFMILQVASGEWSRT